MIKIHLDNLKFRYDVYQIFNLFYNLENIGFVEEDADFSISDKGNIIEVSDDNFRLEFIKRAEIKTKENIKLAVFKFLKSKTGKDLPWGTLIGIRPSKIALGLLEKGKTEEEIIQYYNNCFNTRRDKAKLCYDVALLEKKFINKDSHVISIYIGMPFCPTRCLYCSFASNPIASCINLVNPYLQALEKEIRSISRFIKEKKLKVQCVYFGGGTPTSVDDKCFDYIMKCIFDNLVLEMGVEEFTVECGRPDSLSENKFLTMRNYNVNRISINPQTMNDETLKRIGRNHCSKEVIEKFNQARSLGFNNINMDIIVGLLGEGIKDIENTCESIFKLNPDSVTVHGLSIKRASKLHENIVNNRNLGNLLQEEMNSMYERTFQLAKDLDMKPYYMYRQKNMFGNMENVGYAKPFKEGIYNIQMIEEKQTIIAVGADAVSKVVFLEENRIERFGNVKDVREYINRIDEMIEKKLQLLNILY
ncbi:coproporphyrinogen III oxidase [Clostridium sp. SYSU_GA19001]|uniref:coproporphyrinogen III oxidase n=1 Tax=Clostridium caldaquaticum TaxID=2940653 RepID=UPI00207711C9|nr:coproporphyrinogen III oxidase [Clostridium caldaquaticum]MCM8710447.1 coproporphyrinogen III oxidase [Clostridium caldaquaticum]